MGWSIGYDSNWYRDVGYGVPATCDQPACEQAIDRGLAHVCGQKPFGGDIGCGLYFCDTHLIFDDSVETYRCDRCEAGEPPHQPTSDTLEWIAHKMTDESWGAWRSEHPEWVTWAEKELA